MSLTVGIMQPNYLPWRGFFDLVASVDVLVLLDDVQYTKQDWRNRNRIKTPRGPQWLTVPVEKGATSGRIMDARLVSDCDWKGRSWAARHLGAITQNYSSAPHFAEIYPVFADALSAPHERLVEVNESLLATVLNLLGIPTPTLRSSSLACPGTKTERLLNIMRSVGGAAYLSGPSALEYLDLGQFRSAGMRVSVMDYAYQQYPQLWGDYVDGLSIVDVLMNVGAKEAALISKSRRAPIVVSP